MHKIAWIGGALVASTLLCALVVGTATADPGATSETAQQRSCMPHDGADDKLRLEYGEKALGHGISKDGTLVEIFLAPSGTFTVIKTTPAGLSCVVDFGEGWQTVHQLEEVGLARDTLKSAPGSAAAH